MIEVSSYPGVVSEALALIQPANERRGFTPCLLSRAWQTVPMKQQIVKTVEGVSLH